MHESSFGGGQSDSLQETMHPEYVLATNQRMEELKSFITETPINWDYLKQHYMKKKLWLSGRSQYRLVGTLFETHIHTLIESFAADHPDVTVDPIQSGEVSGQYRFFRPEKEKGTYVQMYREANNGNHRWEDINEYDRLLRVNGLLVVVEAKMTGSNAVIRGVVNARSIDEDIEPLRTRFDEDTFGYMLIAPSERFNQNAISQQSFRERGGVLVPVPTSFAEFQDFTFGCYQEKMDEIAESVRRYKESLLP